MTNSRHFQSGLRARLSASHHPINGPSLEAVRGRRGPRGSGQERLSFCRPQAFTLESRKTGPANICKTVEGQIEVKMSPPGSADESMFPFQFEDCVFTICV